MNWEFVKKRKLRLFVGAVVAVVLFPYLYSRILSPYCRVERRVSSTKSKLPSSTSPGDLRVVCYNIAHGRGVARSNWEGGTQAERAVRLHEIATTLREMNADVVVLNEVDFDASWSGHINQAQRLAELAGYEFVAEERNLDFRVLGWTWRFGNAVLSKYPIASATVVDLPGYSVWETWLAGKKRGISCDIELDANNRIQLVGVHLSHRSEQLRAASAKLLVEMASKSERPMIVVGDLNSTPPGFPETQVAEDGENAMAVFAADGRLRRYSTPLPVSSADMTFHSTKPRRIIDWILIPSECRFKDYRVVASTLSDHRPVVATIEINNRERND